MRWPFVLSVTGVLLLFTGLTMCFPLGISLYFQDGAAAALGKSAAITIVAGLLLRYGFRARQTEHISHREGMAIVALGWTTVGFFGALPFYLAYPSPGFVNAFFESVSGFTTTGASILTNIEALPKALALLAQFYPVAGGHGHYRAVHCHPALSWRGRHAALQSRGAQPGTR